MKQKEETNDLMLYKKHFKAEHFFYQVNSLKSWKSGIYCFK